MRDTPVQREGSAIRPRGNCSGFPGSNCLIIQFQQDRILSLCLFCILVVLVDCDYAFILSSYCDWLLMALQISRSYSLDAINITLLEKRILADMIELQILR